MRHRDDDWVAARPEPTLQDSDRPDNVGAPPRLLDQVRARIRYRHYSYRTEQAYVAWVRRFIHFHGRRHPRFGRSDVATTMIYTHGLNRGGLGVRSPLDDAR